MADFARGRSHLHGSSGRKTGRRRGASGVAVVGQHALEQGLHLAAVPLADADGHAYDLAAWTDHEGGRDAGDLPGVRRLHLRVEEDREGETEVLEVGLDERARGAAVDGHADDYEAAVAVFAPERFE